VTSLGDTPLRCAWSATEKLWWAATIHTPTSPDTSACLPGCCDGPFLCLVEAPACHQHGLSSAAGPHAVSQTVRRPVWPELLLHPGAAQAHIFPSALKNLNPCPAALQPCQLSPTSPLSQPWLNGGTAGRAQLLGVSQASITGTQTREARSPFR